MVLKPRLSPKELMQHARNTKIFDKVLNKVKILSLENGNGLAEFTVAEEHTNHSGKLHNGFVSTVMDFVSSFSFSSHDTGNNYHVSVNMNILFYQCQAKIGDQIQVQAKTLRGGHSIAFLEVLLKNKSTGELLAKGNHNMFILHPHLLDDHSKSHLKKHEHLASKMGDEKYEASLVQMECQKFWNASTRTIWNLRILHVGDGNGSAELKIEEEHLNPLGTLHGGLSTTLIDVVSSLSLNSHSAVKYGHVSVDMHLTFYKSATIGDEIKIESTASKVGKKLAFLEVLIKNKHSNDILVSGTHVKFLLGE